MQLPKWIWISALLLMMSVRQAGASEWDTHSVSLRASIGKIRVQESRIAELIQKKKTVTTPDEMGHVLANITKEHKELTRFYEDFEKERQHIRFEHPEEGAKTERQYRAYRLKSVHEMEAEGGIDGKLNDLKSKVKQHYGEPISAKPTAPPEKKITAEKSAQEEKEKKRIKLSK
jgi:hypothetical protein